MADTRTNRPQATFKHARFADPDFSILIRKAAERQGMQLGQWVVETLEGAARSVLKNEPVEEAALPVRPQDVLPDLVEMVKQMRADQELMMATLQAVAPAGQDADLLTQLRDEQARMRRARWRKR